MSGKATGKQNSESVWSERKESRKEQKEWCVKWVSGRRNQTRGTELVSTYLTSLDEAMKQRLVRRSQAEPDTLSLN